MSLTFKTKKGNKSEDSYMTPRHAWADIEAYLPKDKIVWEAFYGDGKSAEYIKELNCNVISEDVDFFESKIDFNIIVTNPPYSCKPNVFSRLKELNKPFILLVPSSTITKKFYKDTGFAEKCGIIIPKRRIHFIRNGEQTRRSWFDVIYVCYQIKDVNPREIIYL